MDGRFAPEAAVQRNSEGTRSKDPIRDAEVAHRRRPLVPEPTQGGCTPASGWEKGQVENQVGLVRERFFTPRLRFKTLDELNAWLLDKCIAYAKAHRHPELTN
jgi:transposase